MSELPLNPRVETEDIGTYVPDGDEIGEDLDVGDLDDLVAAVEEK